MDFPHMKDGSFPHLDNVDVYKYSNDLDYSRYDDVQMQIQICSVPWDMGEAHVGNRTISGIGNVVAFENESARDAWFDAIPDDECFRWESKYKELHRDNEIMVPLPFDIASKYNYVAISYALFANDGSPLQYEDETGLRRWFWFIREVEFVSPNTTKLHLLNDAWQTFIYRVDIPTMILERGHAPMFATSVSEYLSAPAANCAGLLEPDTVSTNASETAKLQDPLVFDDGNMYVVFITTASLGGWGEVDSSSWRTPAASYYRLDGSPNYRHIAVAAEDYAEFMTLVEAERPNFKQTVQAVYLVSDKLVTLSDPVQFVSGINVYTTSARNRRETLFTLSKEVFGFDSKYANITKLYTYPYSYLEITNEDGESVQVRIEEMQSNVLQCGYMLNSVFDNLNLNARVLNVAGGNATVEFKNIIDRTCYIGGKSLELQFDWAVPTFAIVLQASKEYSYSGYFDRVQARNDLDTAYANAIASADTAKANADRSADTAKANADRSADTAKANTDRDANTRVANAALQVSTNDAIKTANNSLIADTALFDESLNSDNALAASNLIVATTNNQVAATEQQAVIAAASGAATSAISAVSSAVSGDVAGAISSVLGGGVQAASTIAQCNTAINLTESQADASRKNNEEQRTASIYNLTQKADLQKENANTVNTSTNSLITSSTANTAATMKTNASASQSTEKANASATQATAKANASATQTTDRANALRTKNNAEDAIDNTTLQRGLQSPYVFGSFDNARNANVKPKMLVPVVHTQGKDAVQFAGDEFLRYGYRYNRNWQFDGDWNIGRYFTYWKLSDFWVKGLNVPDMYMDKLRFFLFGGVTVWRDPADIGRRTIYENGV